MSFGKFQTTHHIVIVIASKAIHFIDETGTESIHCLTSTTLENLRDANVTPSAYKPPQIHFLTSNKDISELHTPQTTIRMSISFSSKLIRVCIMFNMHQQ